jgi:hypothetical protein
MASKIVRSPDGLRAAAAPCVEDVVIFACFLLMLYLASSLSEQGVPNLSQPSRNCMHGVRHSRLYNPWCPTPACAQERCQTPFCISLEDERPDRYTQERQSCRDTKRVPGTLLSKELCASEEASRRVVYCMLFVWFSA